MLKKFLTAALITSMLILPVSSVTPSVYGEASAAGQSYLPGDVPAETDAEESMTPLVTIWLRLERRGCPQPAYAAGS